MQYDNIITGSIREYIVTTLWPNIEGLLETGNEGSEKLVASTGTSGNLQEAQLDLDFPAYGGRDSMAQRTGGGEDNDFSHEGWKSTLSYAVKAIQSFPEDHPFYGHMPPSNKQAYLIRQVNKKIAYTVIQHLKLKEVLKAVDEKRGRYSLFQMILDRSLFLSKKIEDGSIAIEVDGTILQGINSVMAFIKTHEQPNFDKVSKTTINAIPQYTKTLIAEGIGAIFMQKTFGIGKETTEQLIVSKSLVEHPVGPNDFPDFLIDVKKLTPAMKDRIFSVFPIHPETEIIMVDTKSSTLNKNGGGGGGGNYRLRYPKSLEFNNIAKEFGVPPYISNDAPKSRPISYEEIMRFINLGITNKHQKTYKDQIAQKKWDNVAKLLKKKIEIVYQEVGVDAGHGPVYSVAYVDPHGAYTFEKIHDKAYKIRREDGTDVFELVFYLGQLKSILLGMIKENPNHELKKFESIITKLKDEKDEEKAREKGVEEDETEVIEDKDIPKTLTDLATKYNPMEIWPFMFKWSPKSLKKVSLNALKTKQTESVQKLSERQLRMLIEAITTKAGAPNGIPMRMWSLTQMEKFNYLHSEGVVPTGTTDSVMKDDGYFKKFAEIWADQGHAIRDSYPSETLTSDEIYDILELTYKSVIKYIPEILGASEYVPIFA